MKATFMRWTRTAVVTGLFLLPFVTACSGPRLIGSGPYTSQNAPSDVIRYYLPKDIVLVDALVTSRSTGHVTFKNDFLVDTTLRFSSAEGTVSIQTVPDQNQFFVIGLEPGSASGHHLAIDTYPNGLLKSVNVEAAGQQGEIAKNVLTVVASTAAIALLALDEGKRNAIELVCDQFTKDESQACKDDAQTTPKGKPAPWIPSVPKGTSAPVSTSPAPAGSTAAASNQPSRCPNVCDSLQKLSLRTLFFLAKSADGRNLWRDQVELDHVLTQRQRDQRALQEKIQTAASLEVDSLKDKLQLIDEAVETLQTERKRVAEALDLLLTSFLGGQNLLPQSHRRRFLMAFGLDELPSPDILKEDMTYEQARTALKSYPRVLEMFEKSGIVVTLPPIAQSTANTKSALPTTDSATIFFRPSYATTLTVFARTIAPEGQRAGEERDVIRVSSTKIVDVVSTKSPILTMSFEPEDFAERKLALTFNDRGQLIKLEQAGTSTLASASTSLAEGLLQARDEAATTLSRIAEIQDTTRTIGLSGTVTEIEKLKKQKELLDARLEAAGAAATYDLNLEKQRLDAEIAALEARAALTESRVSQQQQIEIQKLNASVQILQKQIILLKEVIEKNK